MAVSDWARELTQFEETKAGVKGLVDAGITKIPRIFVHPPEILETTPPQAALNNKLPDLPTIDFQGLDDDDIVRREQVAAEIGRACQEWGFFRVVNHGIPKETMEAMLAAVRRFHEQPTEAKTSLYSSDRRQRVKFNNNGSALKDNDRAFWRDMLTLVYSDDHLDPNEIPAVCRSEVQEYIKQMVQIRELLAELLSEALGLDRHHLSSLECMKSQSLACLYYPPCPEPDKTLGTPKHSDTTFLTVLLQDTIGGLQIKHNNQWADVPPVPGSLIVNVGDLLQIISNDKFVSVDHKVIAQAVGPRVSVACFLIPSARACRDPFGPIKELLSEENPAVYREVYFAEYCEHFKKKGQGIVSPLPHYRI